jgi:hypothetical protein
MLDEGEENTLRIHNRSVPFGTIVKLKFEEGE